MEIQPEGERKNDMGRPSFGEQGPHFIFQSSFYTLINQYTAKDTVGKGYGDLAANIGPISEKPFTNTISNQSFN